MSDYTPGDLLPRKKLKKLRLAEISMVDLGADLNATVQVIKRGAPPDGGTNMTETASAAIAASLAAATTKMTEQATQIDTLTKALKVAEDDRDAQKRRADIADLVAKKGGDDEDAILKAADPLVAAEIIKLRKANAAAAKQLADITDEAEVKKFIDRAKIDYVNLPMAADKLGPILKRATGLLPAEDMTELLRVLKAASTLTGEALRTSNNLGQQIIKAGTAEAELEALATAKASKDGVSFAKAYDMVLTERPDLYTRYREETGRVAH
jgi:hypothetical protein